MTDYRVYVLTDNDHIAKAPEVISCESDVEAVENAKQRLNGHDIEIWDGPRVVTRVRSAHKPNDA
jgi:hypothetical protein